MLHRPPFANAGLPHGGVQLIEHRVREDVGCITPALGEMHAGVSGCVLAFPGAHLTSCRGDATNILPPLGSITKGFSSLAQTQVKVKSNVSSKNSQAHVAA